MYGKERAWGCCALGEKTWLFTRETGIGEGDMSKYQHVLMSIT